MLTILLALQAEAYADAGQNEAALESLSEALRLADETGERFYEAELHRLRGEMLLRTSGEEDQAESCFQRALQVARRQEARSLELRAATSLARLWARQGRGSEASRMLAEVYDWFSEGFGTPDLQEAKTLMDGLKSTALAGTLDEKRF